MKNNLEVCILFQDKSNIVIYCQNVVFNPKGFTIQFYDFECNYDEMYINKDSILSFEVYCYEK